MNERFNWPRTADMTLADRVAWMRRLLGSWARVGALHRFGERLGGHVLSVEPQPGVPMPPREAA